MTLKPTLTLTLYDSIAHSRDSNLDPYLRCLRAYRKQSLPSSSAQVPSLSSRRAQARDRRHQNRRRSRRRESPGYGPPSHLASLARQGNRLASRAHHLRHPKVRARRGRWGRSHASCRCCPASKAASMRIRTRSKTRRTAGKTNRTRSTAPNRHRRIATASGLVACAPLRTRRPIFDARSVGRRARARRQRHLRVGR